MDWADDIAYSVHDVEDYYRAGLIPLDRLSLAPRAPREYAGSELEDLAQSAKARWDEHPAKVVSPEHVDDEQWMKAALTLRNWPLSKGYSGSASDAYNMKAMFSTLTKNFVEAPSTSIAGSLAIPLASRLQVAVLKELTWKYVIENPALQTQQHGHRRLIRELFAIYDDVAKEGKKEDGGTILPPRLNEE